MVHPRAARCVRLLHGLAAVPVYGTLLLSLGWLEDTEAFPVAQAATAAPIAQELTVAARGPRISLDQAVSMVLGRYGGKVISAETRSRNGRVIHQIKLLTDDGRVRTVRVDGRTGNIS
ncbi:hypothetical protein BH24PSE2_BH24PSE2_10450 [soil metagenome]